MTTSLTTANIDRTDWLKTFAIAFVLIDHFGYFFVDDAQWWNAAGRLAAPVFFFLLGFAKSRQLPVSWIVLGLVLTGLEYWNADGDRVTLNILLSLALMRLLRPNISTVLVNYRWLGFLVLLGVLIALLPSTLQIVDYGSEGWLWTIFGVCQRLYVDQNARSELRTSIQSPAVMPNLRNEAAMMRFLAGVSASLIYLWMEQIEFEFSVLQFTCVVIWIALLTIYLGGFQRGLSPIQPPPAIAKVVAFVGRHTLEIYAFQLAACELIILLFPDLAA